MRTWFVAWLVAWAAFGLPWTSFSTMAHWGHGSLMPFPERNSSGDDLLNFLFYTPFGFMCWRRGWSVGNTLGVGASMSIFTEFNQVFSTTRFPATTDVVTNVAGAIVGYWVASTW